MWYEDETVRGDRISLGTKRPRCGMNTPNINSMSSGKVHGMRLAVMQVGTRRMESQSQVQGEGQAVTPAVQSLVLSPSIDLNC